MLIIGIDEVGRGPLAGPVVAAAVAFRPGYSNSAIKDSKQLSAKKREALFEEILNACCAWSAVAVGHHRIAQINIRGATKRAMELALRRVQATLAVRGEETGLVLIDGNMEIGTTLPQRTVIKGDSLHIEISAASIVAKVYRDRLMQILETRFPGYGLGLHAGYPTAMHRAAIERIGPCPIHRRTFRGVREFLPFVTNTAL